MGNEKEISQLTVLIINGYKDSFDTELSLVRVPKRLMLR